MLEGAARSLCQSGTYQRLQETKQKIEVMQERVFRLGVSDCQKEHMSFAYFVRSLLRAWS